METLTSFREIKLPLMLEPSGKFFHRFQPLKFFENRQFPNSRNKLHIYAISPDNLTYLQ